MEQNYKQVIVVRKDLNMRKGKIASQVAHASLGAILSLGEEYYEQGNLVGILINKDPRAWDWMTGKFKKICPYVTSEQELLDLYKLALEKGLICKLIQDSGLTEFGGVPTYTTLAIGPDLAENIDPITGHLPLL